MQQEHISILSKYYPLDIKSDLKKLDVESSFSDVTLVSDDQIPVHAHKVVLSLFSPVLKNMLQTNPHDHPLIYLQGVMHQDLLRLLQLFYHGEAQISQNRIQNFLENVKDLQIKEFMKDVLERPAILNETVIDTVENIIIESCEIKKASKNGKTEPLSVLDSIEELLSLDIPCEEKTHEVFGEPHKCPFCEKIFQTKYILALHEESKHPGTKLKCDQCDFQAIKQKTIKEHKETEHEVFDEAHGCPFCEKIFQTKYFLALHVESKHPGTKLMCDQCGFQAIKQKTFKEHLLRHEQSINGISYPCNVCIYTATRKDHLKRHQDKRHKIHLV